MRAGLRQTSGVAVLVCALGTLVYGILELRGRQFLASVMLLLTGLSLLHAAVELLRPSVGE